MTTLIVTPDRNTPGKKDYTGAFLPESRLFAAHRSTHAPNGGVVIPRVTIDISKPPEQRRAQLLAAISGARPVSAIAFFCHGLMRKLPQLGWDLSNVDVLAAQLATHGTADIVAVLYACDTAAGVAPGGDGGFADRLRDELCRAGATNCRVDAHKTAGHAVMNPHVRRFEGMGSGIGGVGGSWIVEPGSEKWNAWKRALRTPFRYDFPFMTIDEIHDEL